MPDSEDITCPSDGPTSMELLRFTLPTLSALLSSEVMSVIDTAVVGASSSMELAALGPAIMLTDSSAYLFFWLNVACTNLVASALARDDAEEAFKSVSDTLWCGATIGVVMSVALYFFGPTALAALCRKAPETLAPATTYLQIRLLTLPALILTMVLQAACTGSKDAVAPLLAVVAGGLLNLAGDMLLVLKLDCGIAGAAIATCVSQAVQLALLWRIVWRKRAAFGVKGGLLQRPPRPRRLGEFLTFAGPIFLVLLGKICCYNSMTIAATSGGFVALAGHQVITSVFFLGCKFGDAISQTAQAYLPSCLTEGTAEGTGRAAGAGAGGVGASPPAQVLARRLLRLGLILGGVVSLSAAAFVTRCPGLFTSDPAVVKQMAAVAPLLALGLVAHPTTMSAEGLLLGARQLKYLARAYAVNIVLFLSALYAVATRGMGLRAVWVSLCAFQFVRLVQFSVRGVQIGLFPWPGRQPGPQ